MSVTEGVGKGVAPYLLLGGLIVGAYLLLKDYDWSQLNPFKDWDPFKPVGDAYRDFVNSVLAANAVPEDPLYKNLVNAPHRNIADEIIASKTSEQWIPVDTPAGQMQMTIIGLPQNPIAEAAIEAPEAKVYTHDEMATMSAGLTSSPGSGYVQRGTSLTGAPLFEVGPWTQAGVYRLDGYDYSIWRNPVSGALDVATIPGQGGSLSSFRNWNPGGEVILW